MQRPRPDLNADLHAIARLLWSFTFMMLGCEWPFFQCTASRQLHSYTSTQFVVTRHCFALAFGCTAVLFLFHWCRPHVLLGGHIALYQDRRPWVLPVVRAPLMPIKCLCVVTVAGIGSLWLNWIHCTRRFSVILALVFQAHSIAQAFPFYGKTAFWRFSYSVCCDCGSAEDWFLDAPTTAKLVLEHAKQSLQAGAPENAILLILGSGSSRLPHELARQAAFAKIVATDVALCEGGNSIRRAMSRWLGGCSNRGEIEWHHAYAQSLPFDDETIDIICDKATIAAIAGTGIAAVTACFEEAARVLRPGGLLISIWMSHSNAHSYLEQSDCSKLFQIISVEHLELGSTNKNSVNSTTLVLVARKQLNQQPTETDGSDCLAASRWNVQQHGSDDDCDRVDVPLTLGYG